MSKEAFFSPDFPAPDEGNGFAVRPNTENRAPTSPSFCFLKPPHRHRFVVISPDPWHGLSASFGLDLPEGRNRGFPRGAETYAPLKNYCVLTPEERAELLRLGNEIDHDVADVMLVVKPQTYRRWLNPKVKARSRTSRHRRGYRLADPAHGDRESLLGLQAHLRRAQKARHFRWPHHHPRHPEAL